MLQSLPNYFLILFILAVFFKKKKIMIMQYLSHKGNKPIEKSAFSGGKSSRLFPCH